MALTFDHDQNDTIAAIATGSSDAGIGIIRISGPAVLRIVEKLFRSPAALKASSCGTVHPSEWKPYTIHYGYIVDPDSGELLDEVLISWMKAPRSYTSEDTAEINTHGGQYVMQKVLSAVLRAGARAAEPGEFTRRAFLHGRIDLSQAEAVMDLIHSRTEFARKSSLSQLGGAVSSSIRPLRAEILHEMAFIESALDDPEHFSLEEYPPSLDVKCRKWTFELQRGIDASENGRILREGIAVTIVGRPNVGKSSLLNALTGTERAIVTGIPGTTRDTLEETVRLGDLVLRLTDTAGIRDTEDEVERIGVARTIQAADTAQLILFLLDSSEKLTAEDLRIVDLTAEAMREGRKCVILLNKSDLPARFCREDIEKLYLYRASGNSSECPPASSAVVPNILTLSLKTGAGLEQLEDRIRRMFVQGNLSESSDLLLCHERQISELRRAKDALLLVRDGIQQGISEEFLTVDLSDAYAALGRILGEVVEDDLIDEIFSEFCLGK